MASCQTRRLATSPSDCQSRPASKERGPHDADGHSTDHDLFYHVPVVGKDSCKSDLARLSRVYAPQHCGRPTWSRCGGRVYPRYFEKTRGFVLDLEKCFNLMPSTPAAEYVWRIWKVLHGSVSVKCKVKLNALIVST